MHGWGVDRALVAALLAATTGCWSSTVIAPAVAGEPESTGYGIQRHTFYAVFAQASLTGVGVTAHSPPTELGREGDSLWLVVERNELDYCVWLRAGAPQCTRAKWAGGSPGM